MKKLQEKGWLVKQSKGSRGPYDLYALKNGRKLLIQVKSHSSRPTRREIRKLRRVAKSKKAKALIMHVDSSGVDSLFVY